MAAAFSTSAASQPNHLLSTPASGQVGSLRHSYSALRHGQSLANVAKIISSDPKISTVEHGLSDFGHDQAREAGKLFAEQFHADNDDDEYCGVAIFSSDFKRARETAQHMADACSSSSIPLFKGGVVLETMLRERNFGTLNGGSDDRYQEVWDIDIKDPTHNEFGVESVYSVVGRTTKLVLGIDDVLSQEGKGDGKWKCILVAHGDVLQILQTGFKKMDGSLHRTLPHLETATVRELRVADAPLCGFHAVE
jgi:broad specificity phosphatase PhoE